LFKVKEQEQSKRSAVLHRCKFLKFAALLRCHGCIAMASFQPIARGESGTTLTECRFSQVSKTTRTTRINTNISGSRALMGF